MIINKYEIKNILGQGKFGKVYLGKHIYNDTEVAVKTEENTEYTQLKISIRTADEISTKLPVTNLHRYKLLKHETTILNYLFHHGCKKLPCIYWFGIYPNTNISCLIMTYYSCTLEQYFEKNIDNERPQQLHVLMLQCIDILEYIHKYFVIHRDIKPQNFMMKHGEVHLIDFGLSTFFVNTDTTHKEMKLQDTIIGTPKYVSYFNHIGEPISRRDDLISLGYVFLYLQNNRYLWWQISQQNTIIEHDQNQEPYTELSIFHSNNQYRKQMKSWEYISTQIDNNITDSYPPIYDYMKYLYQMNYSQTPNYDLFRTYFTDTTLDTGNI
jgi:serine/threonine protein kinase